MYFNRCCERCRLLFLVYMVSLEVSFTNSITMFTPLISSAIVFVDENLIAHPLRFVVVCVWCVCVTTMVL